MDGKHKSKGRAKGEGYVYRDDRDYWYARLTVRDASGTRRNIKRDAVRFHDLRHTHATRLVSAHIPLSEVGRVFGHTQANTTYRYVNANVETARRAGAVLDELNSVKPASDASKPSRPRRGK